MNDLDPRDIDDRFPIVKTPFFAWLMDNDEPVFTVAVRRYLNIGLGKPKTPLSGRHLNSYRCIHHHFYWVKHNERTRHDAG